MNTLNKFGCNKSLIKTPTAILGLILVLSVAQTRLDARLIWSFHRQSVCEKVAYQTYSRSCLTEISADFSLARAKALNIGDPIKRSQAHHQAAANYRDARSSARDQLIARLDIFIP
jgi:hypothetical protein